MKVKCDNCPNTYSMKPKILAMEGMFKLCYHCRKDPPEEYICKGITLSGNRCGMTRQFGSDFCFNHKKGPKIEPLIQTPSEIEDIQNMIEMNRSLISDLRETFETSPIQTQREEAESWATHYMIENDLLEDMLEEIKTKL